MVKTPSEQAEEKKELLIESFENAIKSDKRPYSFRLSERLMDKFQIYAKLKGMDTVQILTELIETKLENKTVFKGESDKIIPVTNTEKQGNVYYEEDIIGHVYYNNTLDSWNGKTYCFKGNPEEHRGLSFMEVEDTAFPVLIINYNDNISAYTINNGLFMRYLNNSDNPELILEYIPDEIVDKFKNNPVNISKKNPKELIQERKKISEYYEKLFDKQEKRIEALEEHIDKYREVNKKLKVIMNDEQLDKMLEFLEKNIRNDKEHKN